MDAHLDNAYAHIRPSVVGRPQSSFNARRRCLDRLHPWRFGAYALCSEKASRYNKSLPHVRQA